MKYTKSELNSMIAFVKLRNKLKRDVDAEELPKTHREVLVKALRKYTPKQIRSLMIEALRCLIVYDD